MNKIISKQNWDALRYPITLRQLSEEEGSGWLATIPMLGQAAFAADGETADEALQELEALRRDLYEDVVASGQPIPMPQDVTEEKKMPSGKWIMRTSPRFHAEMQEAARISGLSFNAYCNHVLERGHATLSMHRAAQEVMQVIAKGIAAQATRSTPESVPVPRQAGRKAHQARQSYTFNTDHGRGVRPSTPQPDGNPLRLAKVA